MLISYCGCVALDLNLIASQVWDVPILLLDFFWSFNHLLLQYLRWQIVIAFNASLCCVVDHSDGLRRCCPRSTAVVNEMIMIGGAVHIAIISAHLVVMIRCCTSFNVDYRRVLNYMVTVSSLVRLLIIWRRCNKQSYWCSRLIDLHLAVTLVLLGENTLAHFDAFIVEHVFFSGELL